MYDAVVVGAGPGGYVAAIKLAQLGKKVALVEKAFLGGTCTNLGCIPTKALLTTSHLYSEVLAKARSFGVKVDAVSYDFSGAKNHMTKTVTMSRKGIEYLVKKNKIDLYSGEARVKDANTVEVGKNKLESKNIVIATGSIPTLFAPFSEIPGIWTSDDVFKMERLPQSVLIVGGGVIGVEFATFFSAVGVKVTLVELMDHILPTEDEDAAQVIFKALKKKGVSIFQRSKVISVEPVENGFKSTIETDTEKLQTTTEKVIVAVGRKPNVPDDIKELKLEMSRGIKTTSSMRTSLENVYAIGDVRGEIMLAHVAMYEGIVAAECIAGKESKMDYSAVPSVIFSSPEIASVGLKQKDADPDKVTVSQFPVSANGRARTMNERDGFVKVVAEKNSGKVLGITIVSPSATDMIMEGVIAVKYGLTTRQLEEAIHPHPTLTETILGALEGVYGKAIHI